MMYCIPFSVRVTILIETRVLSRVQMLLHCDILHFIVRLRIKKTAICAVEMARLFYDKKKHVTKLILFFETSKH
jgi:hypothetical protein